MKILKYIIVINVIYVEKGKENYLNIVINVMVVLVLMHFNNHNCINKSIESNCPICMESIFYSVKQITFMKCGHYIHLECLQDYSKTNYKCPLCLVYVI